MLAHHRGLAITPEDRLRFATRELIAAHGESAKWTREMPTGRRTRRGVEAHRSPAWRRLSGERSPRAAAPESATYRQLGARTHERRRPRTCAHIDVRHATEVPVRHASGDAPTVRSKFGECFRASHVTHDQQHGLEAGCFEGSPTGAAPADDAVQLLAHLHAAAGAASSCVLYARSRTIWCCRYVRAFGSRSRIEGTSRIGRSGGSFGLRGSA